VSFLRTGGGILIPHARAGVRRVEMPQADGGEGTVLPGFRKLFAVWKVSLAIDRRTVRWDGEAGYYRGVRLG